MTEQIEDIKNIGQNEFNLHELVTQLKSALGVVPFVGAGLSIQFGFKGWQEFLMTQAVEAGIEEQIRQRIRNGEYEEAAEDLLKTMAHRAFEDALLAEYGPWRMDGLEIKGTVSLLPRMVSGPVVTTNFDHVLETAFENCNARFERIVWGAKLPQAMQAVMQNRRCLLKLHGDVEDRTDRVLTLTEYLKNYGSSDPANNTFNEPLPNLLRLVLIGRPVLFLGCSLKNDRVIKLLKKLAEEYPDLAHYAVTEAPDTESFTEAKRYFSEHRIRPIWYPCGRHGYVEAIVRFLSDSIYESLSGSRTTHRDVVTAGMKATEAFEILIRRIPEISSVFVIKYHDKLRLGERLSADLAENPSGFISQAAVHDNALDEETEVPSAELRPDFWNRAMREVAEGFVLAISSKVKLKNGSFAHIPMMDFKCAPTQGNIELAKKAFREIGYTHGLLLNSGKSFHYYGNAVIDEQQWRAFLGHSLLLSDFIDTRYVGHALINNECRLRISTTRLNPFVPTVVDVF